jgi:hypothetical protein
LLDRVFLTLEHGHQASPPDREIPLGESIVRLRSRYDGYLTCDFNAPKIHQGHNATLLSVEHDLFTINRVIQAVTMLNPIYDQPLDRWRVKSLELAENRRVESSEQFLYALAKQSVNSKNGGHKNHDYDPNVQFGPKSRRTRIYGKEAECGHIDGVDLTDVVRHEISMMDSCVRRHIQNRAVPNLFTWLDSQRPIDLLSQSWNEFALPATFSNPIPI